MPDVCPELACATWEAHHEEDQRALEALQLSDALRGRLLTRLAEAWRDLNYQYLRSRLKPPSLRLDASSRRWGSWDPARRLITISRRQVFCYTWESVIATLKHEMAHQLVSEGFRVIGEPPHGPAFRQACRLLDVDPAPRDAGGVSLVRPGGAGRAADPADARLLRIQKLLALADRNPNEHEARAAFTRASALMLKYNLDARDLDAQDYEHRYLGPSSGRVPRYRYAIAGILQEFFFVQCIWVDSYVVRTGVRGHRLEVMGKRANVEMAEYVYDCLMRQCDALWKAFKRERGIRVRTAKREYLDGLLAGFRAQLQSSTREHAEAGLVWVGDPELEQFFRRRHPRVTLSRLGGVAASEVREEGVEAGKRLRLHRPVAASSRGRLLTGPRG